MKAKDFDNKFDEGSQDIVDDLDLSTARRVNQKQKRNADTATTASEKPKK